MTDRNNLFSAFPPTSKVTWLEKLTKDRKGADPSDLNWEISDDLLVEPMYHPDDAIESVQFPLAEGKNDWEISEDFNLKDQDLKVVNQQLLDALMNGVNAPRLIFSTAPYKEDWAILFKDIHVDWISIHFYCNDGTEAFKACTSFLEYMHAHKNGNSTTLKGSVNTKFARYFSPVVLHDYIKMLGEELPAFTLFTINAVDQCKETEHTVEELYTMIQQGNELLKNCYHLKFDLEQIASKIQFSVGIGKSYFIQIAKLRALKILWANILDAYKIDHQLTKIEAHFPLSTQGKNSNTNMIRSTTQAMSAVIGGVDRLTVLPSNTHAETPTEFSRRIARNVQHLLKMESHFDEVKDPAAGSYYIEQITMELSKGAWKMFQELN